MQLLEKLRALWIRDAYLVPFSLKVYTQNISSKEKVLYF